jgi:hypothetical protein
MMEAIISSETSVLTRATRYNFPEDGTLLIMQFSPCSPLEVNRYFGGTPHSSSVSKNKPWRNHHESKDKQNSTCNWWVFAGLILRRRRHVPPKRRLTFNRLHNFVPQKVLWEPQFLQAQTMVLLLKMRCHDLCPYKTAGKIKILLISSGLLFEIRRRPAHRVRTVLSDLILYTQTWCCLLFERSQANLFSSIQTNSVAGSSRANYTDSVAYSGLQS